MTNCPVRPGLRDFPGHGIIFVLKLKKSWANQDGLVILDTIGPKPSLLKDIPTRGCSITDQYGRRGNAETIDLGERCMQVIKILQIVVQKNST